MTIHAMHAWIIMLWCQPFGIRLVSFDFLGRVRGFYFFGFPHLLSYFVFCICAFLCGGYLILCGGYLVIWLFEVAKFWHCYPWCQIWLKFWQLTNFNIVFYRDPTVVGKVK